IRRDLQSLSDLGEGQVTPKLQRDDFTLFGRQPSQRPLDDSSELKFLRAHIEPNPGFLRGHTLLAVDAPFLTTRQVNGPPSDRGKEQWQRWRWRRRRSLRSRIVSLPALQEGLLHQVLRVSFRSRLLTGEEQEFWRVLNEPAPPLFLAKRVRRYHSQSTITR